MIVQGFTDEMATLLESRQGVQGVRSRPASLEEVFIATTRGTKGATEKNSSSRLDGQMPRATSLELLAGGDYEF